MRTFLMNGVREPIEGNAKKYCTPDLLTVPTVVPYFPPCVFPIESASFSSPPTGDLDPPRCNRPSFRVQPPCSFLTGCSMIWNTMAGARQTTSFQSDWHID